MELPLQGCNITYIPKDSKKKKHELKITQQGTDPLVLAVQSKEQAEQWLKVTCVAFVSEPVFLPEPLPKICFFLFNVRFFMEAQANSGLACL